MSGLSLCLKSTEFTEIYIYTAGGSSRGWSISRMERKKYRKEDRKVGRTIVTTLYKHRSDTLLNMYGVKLREATF